MVFLVLAISDSSSKTSTVVLLVLPEPHGMAELVTLNLNKHVMLDMSSTVTSISVNLKVLPVEITPTTTELPAFVSLGITLSTEFVNNALLELLMMELSVRVLRSLTPK